MLLRGNTNSFNLLSLKMGRIIQALLTSQGCEKKKNMAGTDDYRGLYNSPYLLALFPR